MENPMTLRLSNRRLAFACVPCFVVTLAYGMVRFARTDAADTLERAVRFYGDLPDRIGDAVTNLKMLPERMDPTCSECR
jgi:hypothetical protein